MTSIAKATDEIAQTNLSGYILASSKETHDKINFEVANMN